jgi:hypothetical protein
MNMPHDAFDGLLVHMVKAEAEVVSQRGLGRIYGLNPATVHYILNGNWKAISHPQWRKVRRKHGLPSSPRYLWRDMRPAWLAWAINHRTEMKGE